MKSTMNTSIPKSRALSLLQWAIDGARKSTWTMHDDPAFVRWREETHSIVRTLFGEPSAQMERLQSLAFMGITLMRSPTDAEDRAAMKKDMQTALAHLEATVFDVKNFWPDDGGPPKPPTSPLTELGQLLERFTAVAHALRKRRQPKEPLLMENEFDVQYLLHALLLTRFSDVRPEDPTPSHAGASGRMDFLLKAERIMVEVKMTRDGLEDKELGEQLIVDIQRYAARQDCDALVCLVYDPERRLRNPTGIRDDVEATESRLKLRVVIAH